MSENNFGKEILELYDLLVNTVDKYDNDYLNEKFLGKNIPQIVEDINRINLNFPGKLYSELEIVPTNPFDFMITPYEEILVTEDFILKKIPKSLKELINKIERYLFREEILVWNL